MVRNNFWRRFGVVLIALLAPVALIGCSGGSNADASGPDSTGGDASTTTTAAAKASTAALTPDGVAQQIADAGIGCSDYAPEVVDPSETVEMAPEPPNSAGSCTIEGTKMTITVFETKDAEEMATAQIKTVYALWAKAMGVTNLTAVKAGKDNRVWIHVSSVSAGDAAATPEQDALLEKIAKSLNGKVVVTDF